MAIHPFTGDVYVDGYTTSTNLPGTSGGAQSASGGGNEGFVTRFNAARTQRLQSSFVGGSFTDYVNALAIHPTSDEVYAAGTTGSTNLPGTTDGVQSAAGGDIYVAGQTNSNSLPGASGGDEAYVARISDDLTLINRIPTPISFLHQSNVPPGTTRTCNEVSIAGLSPNTGMVYVAGAANSQFCVATASGCCPALPAVPAGCAAATYVSDWLDSITFLGNGDYVTLRHSSASPSSTAETRFTVSGQANWFRSSTGNANIACNLDMNEDNVLSATKEGLIFLRAMLGLSGPALINGTGVTLAGGTRCGCRSMPTAAPTFDINHY